MAKKGNSGTKRSPPTTEKFQPQEFGMVPSWLLIGDRCLENPKLILSQHNVLLRYDLYDYCILLYLGSERYWNLDCKGTCVYMSFTPLPFKVWNCTHHAVCQGAMPLGEAINKEEVWNLRWRSDKAYDDCDNIHFKWRWSNPKYTGNHRNIFWNLIRGWSLAKAKQK